MFVVDLILFFRLQRLKNLAAIANRFYEYKYQFPIYSKIQNSTNRR